MEKRSRKRPKGKGQRATSQEPPTKAEKQTALEHVRSHASAIVESYECLLGLVASHQRERRTSDREVTNAEAMRVIENTLGEHLDAFVRLVLAGPGSEEPNTQPDDVLAPLPVLVESKVSHRLTVLEVGPGLSRDASPGQVVRAGFVVAWNLLSLRRLAAKERALQELLGELRATGKRLSSDVRALLEPDADRTLAYPLRPLMLTIPEHDAAMRRLALGALRLPVEVDLCRRWLEAFGREHSGSPGLATPLQRFMARQEEWLEVKEVAWFLGCYPSYVTRLCQDHELEWIGQDRQRRISPGSVLRALRKYRREAFGGTKPIPRNSDERPETDEEVEKKVDAAERSRR